MVLMTLTLAEPLHFSTWERALFGALVVASGALFWRRFGPILNRILTSKKDPDFHLFPIGKRVWDFVWEVMCQAKVIRQRPLPGLAHALVFWGFCAFALVTLNHCAVGFGFGFLDPGGPVGRIYFYSAAVFAVACAVGILGLFIRRFVVRPRWLGGELSWESGFIALLIFMLMTTYLASFFVADASVSARALWWTHTLTLLVFLPIIPHTKHLHLVLSPATVFLSRGGFSRIPPLHGDDDFGLVAGTDLTQLVSLQAYSCVECGRCSEHCPATNTGKLLNPKEIILGMRGYLNDLRAGIGRATAGQVREPGGGVSMHDVRLVRVSMPGRDRTSAHSDRSAARCREYRHMGGRSRRQAFSGAGARGNALGLSTTDRDKFIQKQALPIFDGTQEYCLWLGCMGGYDPKGREIVADFARVMNYLGASYGVLRKEKCTGDPVRRLGNDLVFQQLAEVES